MKKCVILFAETVYFPNFKSLKTAAEKETFQVSKETKEKVNNYIKQGLRVVNLSTWDQTEIKNLLDKYDLPNDHCYNSHEDLKPGDFGYVIRMILEYFDMKVEEVTFVFGQKLDPKYMKEVISIGIDYKNINE